MKKKYIKPDMLVVMRKPSVILCTSSLQLKLGDVPKYTPPANPEEDEGFD